MPIRLNLLAEVQAAEEIRRRDPVKRVIWVAALLVCLMLAWWSWLLMKASIKRNEIGRVESIIASHTNEYQTILDSKKKLAETDHRLSALQQLATNRFLNGNLLNALQRTTVDGVRLTQMSVDQSYTTVEAVKPRVLNGRTVPGAPGTVTEHVSLTLDAKDSSANPGDITISKFRQTIAGNDFFHGLLGNTNEVSLTKCSAPQGLPGEGIFVLFTVKCTFPDKTR